MDTIESKHQSEERLYIGFTLVGKDLIPDEITSKLSIKPDRSFARGAVYKNHASENSLRKHGFWEVSSDNRDLPSNDIVVHFNWLLELLEPAQESLSRILKDENIQARV